jgi:Calcium binding
MNEPDEPTTPACFTSGDKVRVKYGETDPDFPDIPLGGWSGTIEQIERSDEEITYLIQWDNRTLGGMHPIYAKRCERDGLEITSMWLGEESIEPDEGASIPIEQPTRIITPPLSKDDQEDRVRMALGLTRDDPLPDVSQDTLLTYHRYLMKNLKFPFKAFCGEEEIGPGARKRITMTVTALLDPEEDGPIEEDGLICLGRDSGEEVVFPLGEVEVGKKTPNYRLVSDYAFWFHNWSSDSGGHDGWELLGKDGASPSAPPSRRGFIKSIFICGMAGGILGSSIGAALPTIRGAGLAAMVGGIPLALIGMLLLGVFGFFFGAVNRIRHGRLLGAIIGLVVGGIIGAFAGLTILAFPWSLIGIIAGVVVGRILTGHGRIGSRSLVCIILGTCSGIFVAAYRQDGDRAIRGALSGAISGVAAGAGLLLVLIVVLYAMPTVPRHFEVVSEGAADSLEDDDDDDGGLRVRRF